MNEGNPQSRLSSDDLPPDVVARETSGYTRSVWLLDEPLGYQQLQSDLEVDAVIVGAGLAGVSAAYLLALEGRSVALLDDGYVGSGETGRTTAHITWVLDSLYGELADLFGSDDARLIATSHQQAIDQIEDNVRRENIQCDFQRLDGILFLSDKYGRRDLKNEIDALRNLGFDKVYMRDEPPGGAPRLGPCLIYPDQAQFHPLLYLRGLCQAIIRMGGKIFTETHVGHEISREGVTTSGGQRISAGQVIVATNSPINDRYKIHTKQAPYRSYVITAPVARQALPRALYWDTGDGRGRTDITYHYVRLQPWYEDRDLLIVGGRDHKTGQADDGLERWQALEDWSRRHFPGMGEIVHRWSGQVLNPVDALAFIGPESRHSNGVVTITGHSGNGMTYCTIAAMMVRDLVTGRENPWREIYSPNRKTAASAGDFAMENLNVAKEYAKWLSSNDPVEPQNLDRGQGAVIRTEEGIRAAYRDSGGKLHMLSSVCPHLKCKVRWNSTERTFDCPCHGSRFTGTGVAVNGPTHHPLESADNAPPPSS